MIFQQNPSDQAISRNFPETGFDAHHFSTCDLILRVFYKFVRQAGLSVFAKFFVYLSSLAVNWLGRVAFSFNPLHAELAILFFNFDSPSNAAVVDGFDHRCATTAERV